MNRVFLAIYPWFSELNQADVLEVLLREQIQVGNKGSILPHIFGVNSTIVTMLYDAHWFTL